MKKTIILTGIITLIGFVTGNADSNDGKARTEIPIRKDQIIRPRTPDVSTGIDAYYQNGVIYLQFSWDLGCMDVSVTNHATGEQWLDAVCSDSGAEAVCISTSAGNYTIELTTDDGTTYSGTFVL